MHEELFDELALKGFKVSAGHLGENINDFRKGLLGEVFAMDPGPTSSPSSLASWLWSAVAGPSAPTIPSGSSPRPSLTARRSGSRFLFHGHRRAQMRMAARWSAAW
jgi:hypothetical protein